TSEEAEPEFSRDAERNVTLNAPLRVAAKLLSIGSPSPPSRPTPLIASANSAASRGRFWGFVARQLLISPRIGSPTPISCRSSSHVGATPEDSSPLNNWYVITPSA